MKNDLNDTRGGDFAALKIFLEEMLSKYREASDYGFIEDVVRYFLGKDGGPDEIFSDGSFLQLFLNAGDDAAGDIAL